VYYIMRWLDNGHYIVDDKSCTTAPKDDDEDKDMGVRYIQQTGLGMLMLI